MLCERLLAVAFSFHHSALTATTSTGNTIESLFLFFFVFSVSFAEFWIESRAPCFRLHFCILNISDSFGVGFYFSFWNYKRCGGSLATSGSGSGSRTKFFFFIAGWMPKSLLLLWQRQGQGEEAMFELVENFRAFSTSVQSEMKIRGSEPQRFWNSLPVTVPVASCVLSLLLWLRIFTWVVAGNTTRRQRCSARSIKRSASSSLFLFIFSFISPYYTAVNTQKNRHDTARNKRKGYQ